MFTDSSYLKYRNKSRKYFQSANRIFYPMRPIFSLCCGLAIIALSWTPLLPVALAVYFGVSTVSDDVIFFPLLRTLSAIRYIQDGRKKAKAIVTVICTVLGLILGAAIAYFVLLNIPALLALAGLGAGVLGCGMTIFMAVCAVSILICMVFHQPPIIGAWVGAYIAHFIPAFLTAGVDLVVATSLVSAFLMSLIGKHAMRLYFKITTGDSNTDGYRFMLGENDYTRQEDEKLSKVFKVRPEQVTKMRLALISIIKKIKKEDSLFNELIGFRQLRTDSFKDILTALTTAKTEEDASRLKKMLDWQDLESGRLAKTVLKPRATEQEGDVQPVKKEKFIPTSKQARTVWKDPTHAVRKHYGMFSYFTDPKAKYCYLAADFAKRSEEGLQICDKDQSLHLRDDFYKAAVCFRTLRPM